MTLEAHRFEILLCEVNGLKNYHIHIFNIFFSCRKIWEILIPSLFWYRLQDWTYLKENTFSLTSPKGPSLKFDNFMDIIKLDIKRLEFYQLEFKKKLQGELLHFWQVFVLKLPFSSSTNVKNVNCFEINVKNWIF